MERRLYYLRFVLLLCLAIAFLAACSARATVGKRPCEEQTRKFSSDVRSLVINDLNPVIVEGFQSGSSPDLMKRLDDVNSQVYDLHTLECNMGTKEVKDALLLYMTETKGYFNVVAGRSVYGEGSVQAQRLKMDQAQLAFEIIYDDLR